MRIFAAGLCLALLCAPLAWSQEPAATTSTDASPAATDGPADGGPADGGPVEGGPVDETSTSALEAQAGGGVGQLEITLEPSQITVGDRVDADLTLVWMGPEPLEPPRFPTWQDTWGDGEVLQQGKVESSVDGSGRRIYRQRLLLTAFEVGDVELPPVTVVIPLEDGNAEISNRQAVTFRVDSVLPPEPDASNDGSDDAPPQDPTSAEAAAVLAPKPPAPPRALPQQASFYWTTGALALLNLAAAFLLLQRSKLSALAGGELARPQLPPLEALLRHLDGVDARAGSEPVHTAISLSLRHYLGRRLAWNAAGSTSSEIQRQLRRSEIAPNLSQRLLQLLKACDQVKFARQEVSDAVNADRLAQARDLGRQLETLLAPPPVASNHEVTKPAAAQAAPQSATPPEARR